MVTVESTNPLFAYELTVCNKTVNALLIKLLDECFHDFYAFHPIGVTLFRYQFEDKSEGNSLVSNSKHQNMDIHFSKLPVGSVHTQDKFILRRKK